MPHSPCVVSGISKESIFLSKKLHLILNAYVELMRKREYWFKNGLEAISNLQAISISKLYATPPFPIPSWNNSNYFSKNSTNKKLSDKNYPGTSSIPWQKPTAYNWTYVTNPAQYDCRNVGSDVIGQPHRIWDPVWYCSMKIHPARQNWSTL